MCETSGTRALAISGTLGGALLLTTEAVLTEVLNAFAGYHPRIRQAAVENVAGLLRDPQVEVVPQTRDDFLAGLALYQDRPDKQYSLTDCISMRTMRARAVREVLTHDHHFAQEGFVLLLRD